MVALFAITAIGSIGFYIIGGDEHSFVDAVYMTVITLTTVGYGEIIDMTNNPAGRIFTLGLLMVGMGIVAYSVPLLAAFFIEGNLLNIFSGRRMQKQIDDMANHYIVCGDTPASWHVVEELSNTGRRVVLIAPNDESLETASQRLGDIPYIIGDPSDDASLSSAGIERAAGVVAAMDNDKDNVLVVLTARRFATNVRIIASTEAPGIADKLRSAGADSIVNPSRIGGLRMASELVRPTVVSFLDRMLRDKDSELRVEEVTVPEKAAAIGRTLESLRIFEVGGALLLAVQKPGEDFQFKPSPETMVEGGMTLIIMANLDGRNKLEGRLTRSSSIVA
jgi:voltage-gated potassium channel